MNTLLTQLDKTRKLYRELFLKAAEAIDLQLNNLKKSSLCNHCKEDCDINFSEISVFETFPDGCNYKFWQEAALNELKGRISKDIHDKIQKIDKERNNYDCAKCASCCKLASSEFSYEQLKEKARNGDKFAKEFTETFIPYESIDEARKIYPEYVSHIEERFKNDDGINFYHCPKVGADNLCTDYENRPQICRDFPTNPLVVLPPKCGYTKWKDKVEITALLLHAMVEIVEFYKGKLEEILKPQNAKK